MERARDMLAIIEQLQMINRRLLNRLRPMALGHFPLRDILTELVNESAHRDPRIAFSLTAEGSIAATEISWISRSTGACRKV